MKIKKKRDLEMTNKQRSIVFILISTICNVLIMLGLILVLSVLLLLIFKEKGIVALPLVFIIALFGGTLISQKLMNWAIKKWQLEDKMDPLFHSKKQPRNRLD